MCAEASTALRAVAADFFFNCWYLEIPSDNRIRYIPRCIHYHANLWVTNVGSIKKAALRTVFVCITIYWASSHYSQLLCTAIQHYIHLHTVSDCWRSTQRYRNVGEWNRCYRKSQYAADENWTTSTLPSVFTADYSIYQRDNLHTLTLR
jgi:hypothetical protein